MGGIREWDVGCPAKLRHQAGTEHIVSLRRAQSTELTSEWASQDCQNDRLISWPQVQQSERLVYNTSKGSYRAAPGWAWLIDAHVSWT